MVRGMEECDETSQRISKALVFGLDETQPGALHSNRERIMHEFTDLVAVMEMIGLRPRSLDEHAIAAKKAKVEQYLAYSAECGTLQRDATDAEATAAGARVVTGHRAALEGLGRR